MNTDADRLDWVCKNNVRVGRTAISREWRVYDYDMMAYVAYGDSEREAIDNAMSKYGEEK